MNDNDAISSEIDRRKLQKLIDKGIIDVDEISTASTYYLSQVCKCADSVPTYHGYCNKCYTKYEELPIEGEDK